MHVVIVGNGVTGVTAAFRLRKQQPSWRITIVSGESTYHYSRPALMYVFMGHMRYADTKPYEDHVWAEERIELVRDWVVGVDPEKKQLSLHKGGAMDFDKLLIATGSKANKFGWPGQDLNGVQSLWGLYDLELLSKNCVGASRAVIVGGGLIGIEMAEMLHSRGLAVTFLVREKSYWNNILSPEESQMVTRAIQREGFDLRLQSELDEIIDDGNGRCCAVTTKGGERIECQIVCLTAGVSPNVDVVKDTPIPVGRGVLVDWSLRTELPDIYAAGDCAELVTPEGERNAIQQVWYTGKMQGEVVADVMAGLERTYDPGIWYNSAKFLDLEYHVYGRVNMRVEGEMNLFWSHPTEDRSLRIVHTDEGVIGIQTMGIRYRHRVCERWIREKRSVAYVLEHLEEGNFDPEFYRSHEVSIRAAFEGQLV